MSRKLIKAISKMSEGGCLKKRLLLNLKWSKQEEMEAEGEQRWPGEEEEGPQHRKRFRGTPLQRQWQGTRATKNAGGTELWGNLLEPGQRKI